MMFIRGLHVLTLLLAPVALTHAAPITFFGEDVNGNPNARIAFPNSQAARSSFVSQLSGFAVENFEEFANGAGLPLTLTFAGAASATFDGPAGFIQNLSSGTNGFGRFPVSGNNYLETDAAALTLTFNTPITSFGFFGTDIGDFGGQLSLVFSGARRVTETVPHSLGTGARSPQDGSVVFFGYTDLSNPFTSVQFSDSAASDTFGLDDAAIGVGRITAAPEPVSFALLGAGLFGLWVARRRMG